MADNKYNIPEIQATYDNENKAYSTVIYKPGKPVLAEEINLLQEISTSQSTQIINSQLPSGFYKVEPIDLSPTRVVSYKDGEFSFFDPNDGLRKVKKFWMKTSPNYYVNVNGKNIVFTGSNIESPNWVEFDLNDINLDNNNGKNILVYLEMWDQVIYPSVYIPDGEEATYGKPSGTTKDKIFKWGNTDTTYTLDDQLLYPDLVNQLGEVPEASTTFRVQTQYKIKYAEIVPAYNDPEYMYTITPRGNIPISFGLTSKYEKSDVPGLYTIKLNSTDVNNIKTNNYTQSIPVNDTFYAIPIALVHFRQNAEYNPDDTSKVYEGYKYRDILDGIDNNNYYIYPTDIIDLRHVIKYDLNSLKEKTLSKYFNFELNTAVPNHYDESNKEFSFATTESFSKKVISSGASAQLRPVSSSFVKGYNESYFLTPFLSVDSTTKEVGMTSVAIDNSSVNASAVSFEVLAVYTATALGQPYNQLVPASDYTVIGEKIIFNANASKSVRIFINGTLTYNSVKVLVKLITYPRYINNSYSTTSNIYNNVIKEAKKVLITSTAYNWKSYYEDYISVANKKIKFETNCKIIKPNKIAYSNDFVKFNDFITTDFCYNFLSSKNKNHDSLIKTLDLDGILKNNNISKMANGDSGLLIPQIFTLQIRASDKTGNTDYDFVTYGTNNEITINLSTLRDKLYELNPNNYCSVSPFITYISTAASEGATETVIFDIKNATTQEVNITYTSASTNLFINHNFGSANNIVKIEFMVGALLDYDTNFNNGTIVSSGPVVVKEDIQNSGILFSGEICLKRNDTGVTELQSSIDYISGSDSSPNYFESSALYVMKNATGSYKYPVYQFATSVWTYITSTSAPVINSIVEANIVNIGIERTLPIPSGNYQIAPFVSMLGRNRYNQYFNVYYKDAPSVNIVRNIANRQTVKIVSSSDYVYLLKQDYFNNSMSPMRKVPSLIDLLRQDVIADSSTTISSLNSYIIDSGIFRPNVYMDENGPILGESDTSSFYKAKIKEFNFIDEFSRVIEKGNPNSVINEKFSLFNKPYRNVGDSGFPTELKFSSLLKRYEDNLSLSVSAITEKELTFGNGIMILPFVVAFDGQENIQTFMSRPQAKYNDFIKEGSLDELYLMLYIGYYNKTNDFDNLVNMDVLNLKNDVRILRLIGHPLMKPEL